MLSDEVYREARNEARREEYFETHRVCPDCGGEMILITTYPRWYFECKECGLEIYE